MMASRQRILAVDDRPENLLALEVVLAGIDIELVKANSGEQALAATLDSAFAMAILDVQMPRRTGKQVYDVVRARHDALPVLFSTGYGYGSIDEDPVPRGRAQLIQKPYSPQDLLRRVRAILLAERPPPARRVPPRTA